MKIQNEFINFVSPEDLIIHKIFSNRPKDIEDVQNILNSVKKVDVDYIKKYLKEFEKAFPGERFLSTFSKLLKEYKKG